MKPFLFLPFPGLSTPQLRLRQLRPNDELAVFAIRSHREVARYLSRPCDVEVEQSRQFIYNINRGVREGDWVYWALTLSDQDLVVGTICLWNLDPKTKTAEIGYELHPDYQGRGLMQEAVQSVLAYAFQKMQLQSVEAYLHSENERSIRLLERNDFRFLKVAPPEAKFQEEDGLDLVIYTLTRPMAG